MKHNGGKQLEDDPVVKMIPFPVFSFKRRIRFMMFRFERLSFANKLIIGTVIGVFLWILWGSRSVETTQSAESVERAVQQQVVHYCNFPMRLSGTEGLLSLENMFKQPRFQLEMVQILIRHGDRAPSMVITNMDNEECDYDCTFKTADLNHKDLFDDYRESTKYFKTQKFVDRMKHHQVLVPGNRTCQYGQLTQRGFLQHFELGKHLHQAYSGLLTAINDGSLMVRSSIRERCVQSAAAFLFGLLPKNSIKKGVTINISSDIWFREDDNGVPYKCPSLLKIWNKYKQRKDYKTHAAAMEPFMKQYAQLLRVSRASLPTITYLTDAIYTRYCHKHPLPCGPGGCVSQEMAAKAMEFASWAFAENYTAVAEVATHPMLIQMAKRMVNKLQQRSPLKFVLYSGHDSTVTPLLLNLGVHDHKKWTPYATNVAFELWKDMLLDSSKTAEPISYYYFRLLVNGKVMTSKMKFCQEVLFNGELCPIQELIFWLSAGSGMQGMDERYQMLCS